MKCIVLALALIGSAVPAADFVPPRIIATVKSPDGRTAIEVRRLHVARDVFGPLVYRVTRDGQEVLADSPLGIRRADQDFDAATLTLVGGTDARSDRRALHLAARKIAHASRHRARADAAFQEPERRTAGSRSPRTE